jgi:hypothetical protein
MNWELPAIELTAHWIRDGMESRDVCWRVGMSELILGRL